MDADRLFSPLNPLVVKLLHSPLHFLARGGLLTLSYTGRRSRRRITIPVGFQEGDGRVVILVSKAERKRWWQNFDAPRPVELRIRGRTRLGEARLVSVHAPEFASVFHSTFERLPVLPRQFGIDDFEKGTALDERQLSLLARQAQMVAVSLGDSARGD